MLKSDIYKYCEQITKDNDYNRYLAHLFAPEANRKYLNILSAFNNEIAKVKDVTSDPMTSLIRLAWWREAIEEISSKKKSRKHEVVFALAELISNTSITKNELIELVNAREIEIEFDNIKRLEDFDNYISKTSVNLFRLKMKIIDIDDKDILEASDNISKAYAIAGVIRSIPFYLKSKKTFVADEYFSNNNINKVKILDGLNLDKLSLLVEDLYNKSSSLLEKSRQHKDTLTKNVKMLDAYARITHIYLNKIRKSDFDIVNNNIEFSRMGLIFRMLVAKW